MGGISRRSLLKCAAASPTLAAASWGDWVPSPENPLRVVVVGAGAFGGWTAFHLQRLGAQVTLLDAWGPGNSRSSSGGETRVIRGIYGEDEVYVQMVTRAFEQWTEYQEQWGVSLYQQTGLLWMFSGDDSYAQKSLPLAEKYRLPIDELVADEAQRRFPQVDFDGITSVYFEQLAGFLHARKSCQVVRDQFLKLGGAYRQVTVKPLDEVSGPLEQLEISPHESIQADAFVIACGPWLGKMLPSMIGSHVRPTRQEVFFFGTPTGIDSYDLGQFPIWVDFGERLYYGLPNVDGRGIKFADDTRGELFDPTHGDRRASVEGLNRALEFVKRRFPGMGSPPLLESRVCQYENSPDGHLIIDRHLQAENVWVVGGGSGHGFKLGPAVGEHLASCVLGSAVPHNEFSIARLKSLKAPATQFDQKNPAPTNDK